MSLLADLLAYLERRNVPAAVIGGVALAAHGIARATLDVDLLVLDATVLTDQFWADWRDAGQREVFSGDADDPLAGIVRWTRDDESADLVVGRSSWQTPILKRRTQVPLQDLSLPVVDRADLVLLKLFAGGPQDLVDVEMLIAADPQALPGTVEERLASTPSSVRAAWRRLRDRSA